MQYRKIKYETEVTQIKNQQWDTFSKMWESDFQGS